MNADHCIIFGCTEIDTVKLFALFPPKSDFSLTNAVYKMPTALK